MTLARIRQTCLHGHLLTMVLLASGIVTGEEDGEVARGDGKVTAHPLWTGSTLQLRGVKRQVRGLFVLKEFSDQ